MSVCLWWKIRKKKKEKQCEDGLEGPVPNIPSKPAAPSVTVSDLQTSIELSADAPKLTHVTKGRAHRPKNVRPTTRQSAMPRTRSENSIKVDENIEDFFSKPATPVVNSRPDKKEETPTKSPSTKSTPESKKKMGGIFNFGHKDKEHKDTKGKEPKKGGLLSKLHGSPKMSSSPKQSRISEVQEEPEDVSANNKNSIGLTRSTTENSSLRGSMDNKSEKTKDEQTAKIPRSVTENVSLSGSLKSDKSDSISRKSEDSDSLSRKSDKSNASDSKSDKSGDKSPVNVAENESAESEESDKAKDGKSESISENDTEETGKITELEKENKVENGDVKKEAKRPIHPPSTKRSFGKGDAKKETVSNDTDEEKPVEKDDTKESVKDEKENKETEDKVEKKEEEVKKEVEDSEVDKDQEEPAKVDENKPVARKPGVPGGIGFGLNIMADLKAKQEKRRSQMPSKPAVPPPDQAEKQGSATEEKKSPFGLHQLKPVTKPVPKDNTSVPVKPSDNKSSDSVKTAEVPALKTRTGSVGTDSKTGSSDSKTVTPGAKGDQKGTKNDSFKDSGAEKKPSVTPRPAGLANKPPPPARPKPPPTSSKPTPAPRKSLSSTDSTEHDEEMNKPAKKPADSGVVYDSATLKMSVKDKISKFRGSGGESEAGKGKPLSEPEKKEPVISVDSKKNDSLPGDTEASSSQKSLSKEITPSAVDKGDTSPQAGDLDLKKVEENTAMTDSGIVDDSPRSSVKDALSKFDNDVGLRKHGSLPRHMKPEDALQEGEESPKRPKSMFAALNRPAQKKTTENKPEIPEEKEQDSPTEEVILV